MKKNIIKEILNDPKLKELNQVEQARYVYIKLGKHFSYDHNYYTRPKFIQKRIYERKAKNIKDKVVCTSASRVYAYILSKLGIEAEVKINDPREGDDPKRLRHGYTIFEIDGKQYATDLIYDMNFIKVGLKTESFMKNKEGCNYFEKTNKEIQQIDEKIGYIKNGIYPMEEYMLKIKREMSIIFDGNEENITDEKEKIELERVKSELAGDKGISEIRKRFGVRDNMTAEEKLILKVKYMTENMGFDYLDSMSKEVYLKEFSKNTFTKNDFATINAEKVISCVDKDKKIEKFLVIKFKSENTKIYQIAEGQPIQAITQKDIAKKFDEGMKTLSKGKSQEYMKILVGEEYLKNKGIGLDKIFSKNGIFKQILSGNTTISKLNDITKETKKNVTEQIRTSEMTNEEVGLPDLKGEEK